VYQPEGCLHGKELSSWHHSFEGDQGVYCSKSSDSLSSSAVPRLDAAYPVKLVGGRLLEFVPAELYRYDPSKIHTEGCTCTIQAAELDLVAAPQQWEPGQPHQREPEPQVVPAEPTEPAAPTQTDPPEQRLEDTDWIITEGTNPTHIQVSPPVYVGEDP
jgi:hypothetical protein